MAILLFIILKTEGNQTHTYLILTELKKQNKLKNNILLYLSD